MKFNVSRKDAKNAKGLLSINYKPYFAPLREIKLWISKDKKKFQNG